MIEQRTSFWQWFAQEGFDLIRPHIIQISSEAPRVKMTAARALVKLLNVPGDDLYAPSHRADEDEYMRKSRLLLTEHANIVFQYRPIKPLRGLLIAWAGNRMMALNQDDSLRETDSIVHMLGHLVLGHIDEQQFNIHLEGLREYPKEELRKQEEAYFWAGTFIHDRRLP